MRYEIVGSDLLTTILNVTAVSNSVNVTLRRFWGRPGWIRYVAKVITTMRNCKQMAELNAYTIDKTYQVSQVGRLLLATILNATAVSSKVSVTPSRL